MQHLKPRQRESDGRYDMTTTLGDQVVPIGYCNGYDKEGEPYHTDGHETLDEARECYHEYRLQERTTFMESPDTKRPCAVEGCEEWTRHWADPWNRYLCGEHRSIEVIRALTEPMHEGWRS